MAPTGEQPTKARRGKPKQECLYVLTNPAWPKFVKIGHTCNPKARLATYNTSDPRKGFAYAHVEDVYDRKLAEPLIHEMLASYRHEKTEWFKIHPDDAIRLLRSLHSSKYLES